MRKGVLKNFVKFTEKHLGMTASELLENQWEFRKQWFKVGLSPSKKIFYLLQWKPFNNDEKCFLFHLKSSFRSRDI